MELASSIVRKLGKEGKLVLPAELRRRFDIKVGTELEFFSYGYTLLLQKHVPRCIFCGGSSGVAAVKGKHVCSECLFAMRQI